MATISKRIGRRWDCELGENKAGETAVRSPQVRESSIQSILIMAFHFTVQKRIIEFSQGQSISEPLYIANQRYHEIKNRFGVPVAGDMLLTSVGTIGIPYIVKETDEFYFKDGNLTWFRNFTSKLCARYLYYWVISKEGNGVLNNTTIGSSQKALTISALKNVEITVLSIGKQRRIADILSPPMTT